MGKSADEQQERASKGIGLHRFSLAGDDDEDDERGTERLVAQEVDDDLTDLLFQDPPPRPTYPER